MVDDSSMVFLKCVFYRRCFFLWAYLGIQGYELLQGDGPQGADKGQCVFSPEIGAMWGIKTYPAW